MAKLSRETGLGQKQQLLQRRLHSLPDYLLVWSQSYYKAQASLAHVIPI